MNKCFLLLLAGLLLALRTVAQAPEKAAPDDLVVTAEIVGYEAPDITKTFVHSKRITEVPIYAKMTVRNMTDHPRNISIMTNDWPNSWIADTPSGFSEVSFSDGYAKNKPETYSIPAHEAVIFNCRLWFINGYLIEPKEHYDAKCFRLGFLDLTSWEEVSANNYLSISERAKKAAKIYWSNILTDVINPSITQKMDVKNFYNTYQLPWER